ncbi:MAG: putative glycosyltransferase [Phormidesmis priestleyi Ana]|uniref:Putative glycosyltransferase n=1 Tax=Phormidesmis priestleyi Ana TaxID=1666911 RepID=A0A0P7ZT85_9CYAN|nr:MAG: putative glycosyltransferase [Phormidesmis priestleyi Ana]
MPSFGITLPVRNRKAFTTAILQQLTDQVAQQVPTHSVQPADIQIIVVDDGSHDGTPELIQQRFPKVHLLRGDGNLWWTGAIAQAMTYAASELHTDYIIWLNDDITLADDFIAQVIQHCLSLNGQPNGQLNDQPNDQPNNKTLIGGIVCDQQHPHWIVFGGVIAGQLINDIKQFEQPVLGVDTLNGNIAILPTQIITDIGLPDVQRFRHYGGDFEYICRAKRNGYRVQLSKALHATTEYRPTDVIRYMPLWIQWAISPRLVDKWRVLQNLSCRRSPHNVEHMVNSIHRAKPTVPKWKYLSFYCRKLVKIIGSEFIPWPIKQRRIQAYFQRQNIPDDIIQAVWNQP